MMIHKKKERTFLKTNWEKLTYFLVKHQAMATNRPEKYKNEKVEPGEINLELALEENPRLLAPLIVLLVQHPIFQKRFKKVPKDIMETVNALRKGEIKSKDCRYEPYKKLVQLCGIIRDKRVKKASDRKIRKEWRLAPDVVEKINSETAKGKFKNSTDFLEAIIRDYSAS